MKDDLVWIVEQTTSKTGEKWGLLLHWRGRVIEAGRVGRSGAVGGRAARRVLAAAPTTVTSHRPPEKQKEATRHHRDNQRVTRGGRKRIHQKMMQG